MPDMRQPGRFPQRGSQRRGRQAPPPKPTPTWVKVGLIASPIVLVALIVPLFKRDTVEEKPQVVVEDPNVRINSLTSRVAGFRADLKKVHADTDSASRKRLADALRGRIEKWMEEWDEIFEPKRDSRGRLPAELQAYGKDRAAVQEMRLDLLKISDL